MQDGAVPEVERSNEGKAQVQLQSQQTQLGPVL